MHLAAALGAGDLEDAEVAGDGVVLEELGLADDLLREPPDLVHEVLALELAALHLLELILPVPGHLRLGERLDAETGQKGDERKRLGRRLQFAQFAEHVLLCDEAFDDGCARGRSAEAAFAHRFAKFFVIDEFARAFHRAEQGCFRVARRRLGDVGLHLDGAGADALVLVHGHKSR